VVGRMSYGRSALTTGHLRGFGDTTPCRMTGMTSHGVVSPKISYLVDDQAEDVRVEEREHRGAPAFGFRLYGSGCMVF